VWALRDVSFEVREGEALGIIGRNGAGKSTLLKILSRITRPTEGHADLTGRVGSLLEVGTGFHPELTGRENIFLNGAILGMKRAEIVRKFDEIVAFAEVEKFIDTPVKHYSSGMYMRLAFSVAAHLDPDVLLVDEVLAVGDAAFQRKCLGKLSDAARGGRTLLFVSHNLIAVESLCEGALLLDEGGIVLQGDARQVVQKYLTSENVSVARASLKSARRRFGSGEIRFVSVDVRRQGASIGGVIRSGEGFLIRLGYRCHDRVLHPVFSVALFSMMGVAVFGVHTTDLDFDIPEVSQDGYIELDIERANLLPGRYLVHIAVGDYTNAHRYDHVIDAAEFDIEQADVYGSGRVGAAGWSLIFLPCSWRGPHAG
jgi:lipopolysaccharide transport system ATP-binding protein